MIEMLPLFTIVPFRVVVLALFAMKVPAFVSEVRVAVSRLRNHACANGAQGAAGDGCATG